MPLDPHALEVLEATSRTFLLPILRLRGRLREAVAAAYLGMRAIDEIEDHPRLGSPVKATLLRGIARAIQSGGEAADCSAVLASHAELLPEVTMELDAWLSLPAPEIAPRVADAVASMAERMASWVETGWTIRRASDLSAYTYAVAGAVGLLLADLWAWSDGLRTDRRLAVAFGRALQVVNVLRNRREDLERGVDLYPPGWTEADLHAWARRQLDLADQYVASLPEGSIREFCRLPRDLARATLGALAQGRSRLSRGEVLAIAGGG